MLFTEEEAPLLKAWIVKRLEDTSDADSDVLADYVLALLRHEGTLSSIRKLCEEEIPDFLREDASVFVDDVFNAISQKSFVPGGRPLTAQSRIQPESNESSNNSGIPDSTPTAPAASLERGTKRSFHDRDDDSTAGRDGPDHGSYKQARRNGNETSGGGRGARGSQQQQHQQQQGGFGPYPAFSGAVQDMPAFDPAAMEALMRQIHAMGMPMLPLAGFAPQWGQQPQQQQRRRPRCRDFDTKGYCARGNTCNFDHGSESLYLPPQSVGDEYDPHDAMLSRASIPFSPFPASNYHRDSHNASSNGHHNQRTRGGRKRPRAAFSADGPVHDRSKSTIVVENIPEEDFSEDSVRDFFQQFGPIVEVTMQPYKHLAVVKFDSWNAANAAYSSPKVIFDNRFVKVFWYKEDAGGGGSSGKNKHKQAPKGPGSASGDTAMVNTEPEIDMEEFLRKQESAQKAHEEKMQKKQELEKQRLEVERRQQELLAKQREEKQRLQAKLAAVSRGTTATTPDPTAAPTTAPLTGTDALRAQLAALEEEAKLLGIDPNAAADDAASESSWPGPSAYRGGGYRGRGGAFRARGGFAPRGYCGGYRSGARGGAAGSVHAAYAAYSLDNRPRVVVVTGADFSVGETDESLRHFLLAIGDFTDVQSTPAGAHITFGDRKTAERFMAAVAHAGGAIDGIAGPLELAWGANAAPSTAAAAAAPQTPAEEEAGGDASRDDDDDDNDDEGERAKDAAEREPREVHEQGDMDYDFADENDWEAA